MDAEPDYVTVLGRDDHRAMVAIMHYERVRDEWVQKKVSEVMPYRQAVALANSWAAALQLEVR